MHPVPEQRGPDPDWCEVGPGAGGPLLVALGGLPVPGRGAAFEFGGLRARLGVHALLLRDPAGAWYTRGVGGAARDLAGLVTWLRAQQERLAPTRTVLVGNSAGGYAALALGALLDADEVVAVVPRSALADEVNDALGDDRWQDRRREVAADLAGAAYGDLATLVPQEAARRGPRPYATRLRVLSAVDNALDRAHATRLSGLPELVTSLYPRGDHQLAAVLARSGELDRVVASALQVDVPAASPRGTAPGCAPTTAAGSAT